MNPLAHLSNLLQQFDTCTRDLGAIRQSLFSCLTCNPPPIDASEPYAPAGVCYSCSISCHGEHVLVELFNKRNFVCDCGTTRLPDTSPCTLRINATTGQKGDVTGEEAAKGNKYDKNFRNQFCGCGEQYDANEQKGTMFQCLGLGYADEGGCGEDWWHPECMVGLNHEEYKLSVQKQQEDPEEFRKKFSTMIKKELSFERSEEDANGHENARRPSIITEIHGNVTGPARNAVPSVGMTPAIDLALSNPNGADGNDTAAGIEEEQEEDEDPLPPGFPQEDDFDHMLCYKCVEANPWIKRYAGTPGFLPPVYNDATLNAVQVKDKEASTPALPSTDEDSKKRKAEDDEEPSTTPMGPPKRQRSVDPSATLSSIPEGETTTLALTLKKPSPDSSICKLDSLPPAPDSSIPFSLFLQPDFRDYLCHCAKCFPLLKSHPQLLEEEETYEPPMSADGENEGAASAGTGSIYDRGEAAFNNMDRVRAIQGAMAYAHLKDNLKGFLKPFAESGTAVGAEDIKAYFEKLRGDEQGIKEAAGGAKASKGDEDDAGPGADGRKEQGGY
jgi:E3 ubiquitin-protein ligase UBR7